MQNPLCVIEYKAYTGSLKDISVGKREMVGQFASYGTPDLVGDVSHKGMFDKTWSEAKNRVKHIYEHDTSKPIGRIQDLWDDNQGAYYKSKVPNHKFGDDVLEMAEAGLINEHSFGYVARRASRNNHGGRDLKDVIHTEVTTVGGGYAIHGNTPLIKVSKSLTNLDSLESIVDQMNVKYKALHNFCYKSNASDETLEDMEHKMGLLLLEIKQLQQTIIDLKASSVHAPEEGPAQRTEVKSLHVLDLTASVNNAILNLLN
jgi:HK97 family phage prohead protease